MQKIKTLSKLLMISSMLFFFTGCGGGSSSVTSEMGVTQQEIAIDKIESYANHTEESLNIKDYEKAGISGVTQENLEEINAVIRNLTAEEVDTQEEIQILVDKLGLSITVDKNDTDDDTEVVNNHAPTASNVKIIGTAKVGSTLTLNYTFNDSDGDKEGESIIAWSTPTKELQRGTSRTFTIPKGYEGDSIGAWVYPVDAKGLKSTKGYDAS